MPAIEISRLRARIQLLTKLVNSPVDLAQKLTRFYESYSDLTFRSGSFSVKAGNYPAYRTPPLMNRELETALSGFVDSKPGQILELIDLLAIKPQREPRQLAAALLGAFPAPFFDGVTHRIAEWAAASEVPDDLVWIFKLGTRRIRTETPEIWLRLLKSWLVSKDSKEKRIAVHGLTSMIDDAKSSSLPLIFKYLQPLLHQSDPVVLPYLETILEKLAKKSENETVYFIKQTLSNSKSPTLIRMIRRNLEIFSSEGQESLRSFLRNLQNTGI